MVERVGTARATLSLTPDPPATGAVHGTIVLDGAPPEALARTTVRFGSAMPAMAMSGPSGSARRTGPARWEFDTSLGMATSWSVSVRFSGGVDGTAVYRFAVSGPDGAGGAPGMPGMPSSGAPDAWRYAALALAALLSAGVIVVVVRRDRRPLTLAIVSGAAAVVVGLAFVRARYATPAMDMAVMASVAGAAATPVTLAPVRAVPDSTEIHAPGTIAPLLTQDVVTRAAGILTGFSAYAGDRVRAGQTIASLDAPELGSRAAAAAAEAAGQAATARSADIAARHHAPSGVVIARADGAALQHDLAAARADGAAKAEQVRYWDGELRREKTLLDQGAVALQEYQDERAQSAAARGGYAAASAKAGALEQQLAAARAKALDALAGVEQMQAQAVAAHAAARKAAAQASTEATLAGFATVTSPGDAIVVKRLVDPGVYVQAGTPIARLAVVARLRVQANVAQGDLASVAVGTPVDVRLPDGGTVHGRVSSLAPVADGTTHTAAVEAIVDNRRAQLVPGGFVEVTLHARAPRAGGVAVPSGALVGSGANAAVWTDVNRTAHRVPVRVLRDDGTTAVVSGPLERRARVVVEGAAALQEGQPIAESRG